MLSGCNRLQLDGSFIRIQPSIVQCIANLWTRKPYFTASCWRFPELPDRFIAALTEIASRVLETCHTLGLLWI